eukprot:CAMPEP_0195148124 /NCGR_PEP_ID=MMETSP0448-20130528/174653_1 /TAXON_ID=66468 /ORGANISM="Heterocapsa triquestra, Strain CCMP 448" /LENGTH=176 /DNA_ID=CAMNT_0040186729 /DNA_START=8 /DNA_END=535 /DNA_ORIENTATION=+
MKHRGHIFTHSEDVVPKWGSLTVGSLVEFHLYFDGEGLGAEECVARKVLRLTLPWMTAQKNFGEDGERLPDFEKKIGVTMRAYQWMYVDGSQSPLPFILFEVWGRPNAIVQAVLEVTAAGVVSEAEMLVPESRLWKLDIEQLRSRCASVELSPDVTITDPMRCRTLAFKGPREECG